MPGSTFDRQLGIVVTEPSLTWQPAYIGIGSNLDSPAQQVERAIQAIAELEGCFLAARSSLYRSAPMGPVEQPDFTNAAVSIMTIADPLTLLSKLQEIENAQGRKRDGEHWGPRTLDLDLLMHGRTVMDDPDLTLPHPGIALRNFVLLPLAEIAPAVTVPGLASVATLCRRIVDEQPEIEQIPN